MPSTAIYNFSYDDHKHTLRVTFITGMVYDYKNVPQKVYEAMKASFSKGIFFNKHIKGAYKFVKIE